MNVTARWPPFVGTKFAATSSTGRKWEYASGKLTRADTGELVLSRTAKSGPLRHWERGGSSLLPREFTTAQWKKEDFNGNQRVDHVLYRHKLTSPSEAAALDAPNILAHIAIKREKPPLGPAPRHGTWTEGYARATPLRLAGSSHEDKDELALLLTLAAFPLLEFVDQFYMDPKMARYMASG